MRDSDVILAIIASAAANWLLADNHARNMLTERVVGNVDKRTMFLLAAILLFFFVGLFPQGIAPVLVLVLVLRFRDFEGLPPQLRPTHFAGGTFFEPVKRRSGRADRHAGFESPPAMSAPLADL